MTWAELVALAERGGFYVGSATFLETRHLAELHVGDDTNWQFWGDSMSKVKRALCRAVEKIREAR